MIAERLEPDKILFGLKGNFSEAIDRLCRQSAVPDLAARLHAKEADSDNNRYSYIGNGIAVPHVRMDNLEGPELILGLSSEGISFGNHTINVVLLLATPADQPPQHLQLLQRVGTLLPAIRDELLAQRDARRVLQVIARAEQQAALPTYLNLTQEQISFELQTDLTNGLASDEAHNRLSRYGANALQRSGSDPWRLKLLRNLFSFFAILLWIAALLCFVPGVDLPQLGIAILTVVLINGLFAFLQEYKSDRALEMLQQLISQRCQVIRDGKAQETDAQDPEEACLVYTVAWRSADRCDDQRHARVGI